MTKDDSSSAARLESIARETFAAMPEEFRVHIGDIVFGIEEWPSREILDYFGMESRYELTGLYEGRPVDEQSQWDVPTGQPDRITLFRQPLLAEWRETGVDLNALIRHVVIHEVGHHFGLSDEDMHALEDEVGGEAE